MSLPQFSAPAAVEIRDLHKRFGGVHALRGVSLSLAAGEVVGLLGENGAGKSTLTNILSGVFKPDSGQLFIDGVPRQFVHEPAEAVALGIATVHQSSGLLSNLTVAENLVLGQEPGMPGLPFLIRNKDTIKQAKAIADSTGIELNLTAIAGSLTVAERQRVEIVKAVHQASKLIIFDEPTAALAAPEVEELFNAIRQVKATGIPVLYVSHRLDEIPIICDRSVILRDGEVVGALDKAHSVPDEIIPLLVGRQLEDQFPTLKPPDKETIISAKDISTKDIESTSLVVKKGEILGLTGAVGAGQREIVRAIAGIEEAQGSIEVNNKTVVMGRPDLAHKAGIVYVSGDRGADGVFPDLSVWRNTSVIAARKLAKWGFISNITEKKLGINLMQMFTVKAPSPDGAITTLSGGNQQKVLLARGAAVQPTVLLLDDPTSGVDVGARRQIYDLIAELAQGGMAVILSTSDNAELRSMCHRVLLFDEGKVIAELEATEATEEKLLRLRENQQDGEK